MNGMNFELPPFLAAIGKSPLVYFPNPGNAGDSLIAAATYQLLDRLGLDYATPDEKRFDPAGKTILLGGGGNLVGEGTVSFRRLSAMHRNARHLVLLPHTIRNVDGLLARLGENVDLICRERVSYDYVRDSGTRAGVHLANDMALGADAGALIAAASAPFAGSRLAFRYAFARLVGRPAYISGHAALNAVAAPFKIRSFRPERDGVLNAFRLDGERTAISIPDDNIDLSSLFACGADDKTSSRLAAGRMLKFIERFREVHTNRLHVAIAAALLGKTVFFHPNNYYKCRAVYEFSLKDRFPNIRWMEADSTGFREAR